MAHKFYRCVRTCISVAIRVPFHCCSSQLLLLGWLHLITTDCRCRRRRRRRRPFVVARIVRACARRRVQLRSLQTRTSNYNEAPPLTCEMLASDGKRNEMPKRTKNDLKCVYHRSLVTPLPVVVWQQFLSATTLAIFNFVDRIFVLAARAQMSNTLQLAAQTHGSQSVEC